MTNAEKFKEDFGYDIDIDAMTICPFKNVETACWDKDVHCRECLDDYWYNKEYQGEPTIPLSVIEKIKANIDKLPDLNPDYPMDMTTHVSKWAVFEIIDKAVKEIKDEG